MKRAILILLVLAGCSAGPDETPAAAPVALVKTAPAAKTTLSDTVLAYGAAEFLPAGERTIPAPAESLVVSVEVALGDPVQAGQPLMTLAPSSTARLDLEKALGDARTASAAYARAMRLRTTGLNSDAEVETARAAADLAEATAKSLQARSAGVRVIRAPIAGVVETLPAAAGEVVAQGAPLVKLGDLNSIRVRLGVDALTVGRVRSGAVVALQPLGGQDQALAAIVDAVDLRADPQTRLAAVLVRVPASAQMSPGQPLQGRIALDDRQNVLAAPQAALLYQGDRPYVFVIAAGVAHRRDVKLGLQDGNQTEIIRGVVAGERVVIEGGTGLEDGMAVREVADVRQ